MRVYTSVHLDVEGKAKLFPEAGGFLDLGHDLVYEGLAPKARDYRHHKEKIDLAEKGPDGCERCSGIKGKACLTACCANGAEGVFNVVVRLRFHVHGDEVRPGLYEAGEKMVRAINHEVDVEEDVIGSVNGFHHGRAKRDIVDKMTIHDIEVKPVGPTGNRPGALFRNAGEIRRKDGWRHNPIGGSPTLHPQTLACFASTVQRKLRSLGWG